VKHTPNRTSSPMARDVDDCGRDVGTSVANPRRVRVDADGRPSTTAASASADRD
jgi:hypothetical protein